MKYTLALSIILAWPGLSAAAEPLVEAQTSTRQIIRWSVLGTGTALLGLGAASYLGGVSDEDSIRDAARDPQGRIRGLTQREAAALEGDVGTQKTMGAVGVGLGIAAIGAGVYLWITEPPPAAPLKATPEPEEAPVEPFGMGPTLTPIVSATGAGLGLVVRF